MTLIAPILQKSTAKIRFSVDAVKQAEEMLPLHQAKSQLEQSLEKQLLSFSHDESFSVIKDEGINPLVQAVHRAFSEHRPLLLTPDIIWITIAQGFAQHVNNQAENLRDRFVQHQGKKELHVVVTEIPRDASEWAKNIQEWVLQIRDHEGADLYRALECNFSTSTAITRTVSQVVMMDAFKQYFDYVSYCICGIPEITLLGSVEDWQEISHRVEIIAEYDLKWWSDRMKPICREFIETASGKPSVDFWRCIYKPQPVYGGELITGWLADLFPYILDFVTRVANVRNPVLEINNCDLPKKGEISFGIDARSLPLGLSQVPIKLKTNHKEYSLDLIAGFIGVGQNLKDGTLQPEIGWFITEGDRFSQLLDQIQQQHLTQPPSKDFRLLEMPKEHIQLLTRFDGATLYPDSGHSWVIAKADVFLHYTFAQGDLFKDHTANHLINLEDGRCIAYVYSYRLEKRWVVVGDCVEYPHRLFGDLHPDHRLENPVVIAESIPQLFERIFQAEGRYYFDDPCFVL